MKANEILRHHFERRKRGGYSLRALARDLEVSPAFVSNVFSGKKKIPAKMIARAAKILDIDSETVLEIRRQVEPGAAVFKAPSASAAWKVGAKKNLSSLRQWFYVAIMELTCCADFDGSIATLARRLKLSRTTVEIAVRELTALGLLIEKNGRIVKNEAYLRLASATSAPEIRNFHRQMLKKAEEELAGAEGFEQRLITGITVTADPQRLAVAKKMLSDALHDIANYLSDGGEATEVYHVGAQLFPLTKEK